MEVRLRAALQTVVVIAAMAVVPVSHAVERAYLFPASEVRATSAPEGFAHYALRARDGVEVHAFGLDAPPGGRTVVYFHNNRETAASEADLARALHARGFGVLLVEYRGYGESRGASPTEEGLYLDAECALDMLAQRGVGPERVVLFGASLGTGVAAEMAQRGRGARLVLVTPYTSIPGLVSDAAPGVPARLLVADAFDTLGKAEDIRIPTLVIHGDADEIVPFWMGERVAGAIRGARFERVPGAHHGDVFARDREHLLAAITALGG